MEQRFKKGGDNLHSPITQTSLLDKHLLLTNVIVYCIVPEKHFKIS